MYILQVGLFFSQPSPTRIYFFPHLLLLFCVLREHSDTFYGLKLAHSALKAQKSLKALNQCLKKCKNAKIRDFFTYLGPIFFPRPIFFCTPMARTLCTIYIPVWIKKKISFYSWKKQEPVSIALSTSSSFFGLSLLARLVPMDSVLKSSILIVQRLALHQNGVEFRQQFNGAIRTSLSAPHDNVRRRMRLRLNIPFGDSQDIISLFHCDLSNPTVCKFIVIDRSYCIRIILTRVILLY